MRIFAILLMLCSLANAAPARVQYVTAPSGGFPGNPIVTASITTTTGNTLVVFGRDASQSISSISDGTNTFTQAAACGTGEPIMSVWYSQNITGVTHTVSVTFTGNTGAAWVIVAEYNGVASSSYDSGASGCNFVTTTGTTVSSTSFSTATSGEVVILASSDNGGFTYTAGTNFTLISGSIESGKGGFEQYVTTTVLTSYTATIIASGSGFSNRNAVWISLKPAAVTTGPKHKVTM